MARAEVGDDVYGDDPTVRALEERTAAILGQEAAVFMPTGTDEQPGRAPRPHRGRRRDPGRRRSPHLYQRRRRTRRALGDPGKGPSWRERHLHRRTTSFDAIRVPHRFNPKTLPPPTKLLAVENTHNGGGGTVWPLERIEEVARAARSRGLALHLDGARLWNASAATGIPEAKYASFFDTVSVCFSKGLGAPVGSALAGPASVRRESAPLQADVRRRTCDRRACSPPPRSTPSTTIGRTWAPTTRKRDGSRRPSRSFPGIEIDVSLVQTNIVRFRVTGTSPFEFVERCYAEGVHMLGSSPDRVRAVLHRDISSNQVDAAISAIRRAVPVPVKS